LFNTIDISSVSLSSLTLSAGEPISRLVLKPFAPAVTRRSEKIAPASLR